MRKIIAKPADGEKNPPLSLTAVLVLAGGTGERLGGVSKADLQLGGKRLLDWAYTGLGQPQQLSVLPGSAPLVLLAPQTVVLPDPLPRPSYQLMEDPPGSGPAWAVSAGAEFLLAQSNPSFSVTDWVGLIPVDAPRAGECLPILVAHLVKQLAIGKPVEAVIAEANGYQQSVIGVFQVGAVCRAGREIRGLNPPRRSMKALLKQLAVETCVVPDQLAADLDTPADYRAWQQRI